MFSADFFFVDLQYSICDYPRESSFFFSLISLIFFFVDLQYSICDYLREEYRYLLPVKQIKNPIVTVGFFINKYNLLL